MHENHHTAKAICKYTIKDQLDCSDIAKLHQHIKNKIGTTSTFVFDFSETSAFNIITGQFFMMLDTWRHQYNFRVKMINVSEELLASLALLGISLTHLISGEHINE